MIFKCKCHEPPFSYLDFDTINLGEDQNGAEVTIDACKQCGKKWLKYLIEQPHYSYSGRWWRAPITGVADTGITSEIAKDYLESLEWCFVGGSFHQAGIHKIKRPIRVV